MKKISLIIGALICVSLVTSAQKTGMISGKTYSIQLTQTSGDVAGWKWATDEITFKGDMLGSKMMHEHAKFQDADCVVNADSSSKKGYKMTFAAEKSNDAGDKVKWKGSVTGSQIKGTVEWTSKQGTKSYTFTGNKK